MHMTKLERAAQLSARGIATNEIQKILGVSKAWIERAKSDSSFLALLHAYKDNSLTEEDLATGLALEEKHTHTSAQNELETINDRYTALEHKVIGQLHDHVSLCTDPRQLTGILAAISARQAAMNKTPLIQINQQNNTTVNQRVVTLSLPAHAIGKDAIQLNANNEVIAVEGRSLSSLTTQEASEVIEQARVRRSQSNEEQLAEILEDL